MRGAGPAQVARLIDELRARGVVVLHADPPVDDSPWPLGLAFSLTLAVMAMVWLASSL